MGRGKRDTGDVGPGDLGGTPVAGAADVPAAGAVPGEGSWLLLPLSPPAGAAAPESSWEAVLPVFAGLELCGWWGPRWTLAAGMAIRDLQ